ncbi:MAG: pentapeptide repeat-containing protein [Anaerolineae bacterium]|nr:pentapeptide repeat-containing protein [Anaerolineae bacterium]
MLARYALANLSGIDLRRAQLQGANLNTNLNYVNLTGAFYNVDTIWLADFDPIQAGAKTEAR